jgi:hypothetical protein
MATKSKAVFVRLPDEERERWKAAAAREMRSVADWIRMLAARELDRVAKEK